MVSTCFWVIYIEIELLLLDWSEKNGSKCRNRLWNTEFQDLSLDPIEAEKL